MSTFLEWREARIEPAARRGRGFTLVEMMVVLAIAAILSGILFSGFGTVKEGNRRTSCQSNLSAIYQASRLYAADSGGAFPYYNPNSAGFGTQPQPGIGLWALYTLPDKSNPSIPSTDSNAPTGLYLRNVNALHCPDDDFNRGGTESSILYSGLTANTHVYNPDFLSYQVLDDDGVNTYASFRLDGTKRQLLYLNGSGNRVVRPADDTTVVLWCRFHRHLDSSGATVSGGNNVDNVLFYDGTIQLLPQEQGVLDTSSASNNCTDWQRVPRDRSQVLTTASTCTP